jgi:hypothetical protein
MQPDSPSISVVSQLLDIASLDFLSSYAEYLYKAKQEMAATEDARGCLQGCISALLAAAASKVRLHPKKPAASYPFYPKGYKVTKDCANIVRKGLYLVKLCLDCECTASAVLVLKKIGKIKDQSSEQVRNQLEGIIIPFLCQFSQHIGASIGAPALQAPLQNLSQKAIGVAVKKMEDGWQSRWRAENSGEQIRAVVAIAELSGTQDVITSKCVPYQNPGVSVSISYRVYPRVNALSWNEESWKILLTELQVRQNDPTCSLKGLDEVVRAMGLKYAANVSFPQKGNEEEEGPLSEVWRDILNRCVETGGIPCLT